MTRILAALLITAFLATSAVSQEASTDQVYACAGEADDAARLACYDAAVGRLKAAEDSGEITTVTRQEVEEVKKDAFGFSFPSLPKFGANNADRKASADLEQIVQPVTSIRRDAYDKVIVTLQNGQIWHQTDSGRVSFSKRRGVEEAVVKRAALGSFRIKLDGGRAFKAKRIQ